MALPVVSSKFPEYLPVHHCEGNLPLWLYLHVCHFCLYCVLQNFWIVWLIKEEVSLHSLSSGRFSQNPYHTLTCSCNGANMRVGKDLWSEQGETISWSRLKLPWPPTVLFIFHLLFATKTLAPFLRDSTCALGWKKKYGKMNITEGTSI